MSAGAAAYEIYGVSGAHGMVHGQFISAGWGLGQGIGIGLVYENGVGHVGTNVSFADYGVIFEKDLPRGLGMGLRMSRAVARIGGTAVFEEMIFGMHGRVPIKQFATASLGVVLGFIYAPQTPTGAALAPRIALVGTR